MKKEVENPTPTQPTPASKDNSLGIISLVFGVTSWAGPGLFFGIPAIVLGTVALKKGRGEKALSIIGIVTGAISTLISLVVLGFIVFAVIWGINHPSEMNRDGSMPLYQQEEQRRFNSLRG